MGQKLSDMKSSLKRRLKRINLIIVITVGILTIINFVFDNSRSTKTKNIITSLNNSVNVTNKLNSNLNLIIDYYIHIVDSIRKIDNHDIAIPNSVKEKINETKDLRIKNYNQNNFMLIGRIINKKRKGIEGLTVFLKNKNDSLKLITDDHGYFQSSIMHDTSLNIDFNANIKDDQNNNLLLKNLTFNHNQTTTQRIKK
ncbi:MAG: hypothetical protein HQ521_10110 [Bacteroidetes bacterium]|nr:hypothetical protein [Bacteroidota bacterium]